MMNIPQELGSYIFQNHGSHSQSSGSPPDYRYSGLHQSYHLNSNSRHSASRQSSSDDDPSYYSNHGSSIPHTFVPYSGRENQTTSLFGLVTGTPTLTTGVIINPSPYATHLLYQNTSSNSTHIRQKQSFGNVIGSIHHPGSSSGFSSQSYTHNYSQNATGYQQQGDNEDNNTSSLEGKVGEVEMSDIHFDTSSALHHHHHQHSYLHKSYNRHQSSGHHHKRKNSVHNQDDDDSETGSSCQTPISTEEYSKSRQSHSDIEKRRRDKMNSYITELSGMIPICNAMSRKLDKLTVLRMAVRHMKTLRGSGVHSYTEGHYKPTFLTDTELKHLILQSAEGFLFVVGCDGGRLLYISESVSQILNYTQSDLLGQSWFDILHPKDVTKVKEQLYRYSSDLAPSERLVDSKSMLPVNGKRLCPGSRRSFFCRMKCKRISIIKGEAGSNSLWKGKSSGEPKFCVIHCTGYLKSWAQIGIEDLENGETDGRSNLSCLVAVGRILNQINSPPPNSKYGPVTFSTRHAIDGKFLFVDQRTTLVLGFLPQELLGTSMYEYFHHDDINSLAAVHKSALGCNEPVITQLYRFRTKNGNWIRLQSTWKAFRNPWTRDIEFVIAKSTLVPTQSETLVSGIEDGIFHNSNQFKFFSGDGNGVIQIENGEIERLINSEVCIRKIGEQIADEAVESAQRSDCSSSNSPIAVLGAKTLSASISNLQLPQLSPTKQSNLLLNLHTSTQVQLSGSNATVDKGHSDRLTSTESTKPSQVESCSSERLSLSNLTNDSVSAALVPSAANASDVNWNRNSNLGETTNVLNETDDEMLSIIIGDAVLPEAPRQRALETGNDEAAVIMSLLEAIDGQGGPVDFSGLPWPLH